MSLNRPAMYALSTILPVLGSLGVVARFYVRRVKKARLGADDWTAFAGLVGLWGIAGVILAGTARGLFGTHTLLDPGTGESSITWRDRKDVKYQYVVWVLSVVAMTVIKLSVVFLYRRIFHISRIFNVYSIGLCILLVLWGIAFVFAEIFECGTRPWAAWTNAKYIIAYCDETSVAQVAICISDIILDLMILGSPIPMIWRLTISTTRKVQVTAVFAMGLVSVAAASVRLYIMIVDAYGTQLGYRDVLGENSKVVIWALVEVVAALLGSCLPTLRPLFSHSSIDSVIGNIRSILSLQSRSTHSSSGKREPGDGMALASIGGTEFTGGKKSGSESAISDVPSRLDVGDGGYMV